MKIIDEYNTEDGCLIECQCGIRLYIFLGSDRECTCGRVYVIKVKVIQKRNVDKRKGDKE